MKTRTESKAIYTALALLLAALTFFVAFPMRASANSAQQYWNGVDAGGAIIVDGECPLEVKHENLTFTMKNVEMDYVYDDEGKYAWQFVAEDSASEVTAEYEFYNPVDFTVQARLAFPYYIDKGDYVKIDQDKYGVTVDGEKVETSLRHTYAGFDTKYRFNTDDETVKLRDDFISDDFFSRDTLVTKYSYTVEISKPNGHNYASTVVKRGQKSTVYSLKQYNGFNTLKDGYAIGRFVNDGDTLTFYAIGDKPTADPAWEVYTDAGRNKKVSATVTKKYEEFTTLGQLIDGQYEGARAEEEGISQVDWYNATIDMFNNDELLAYGILCNLSQSRSSLLHWYEYTLDVPSKATVINAVTAPMIPSVDMGYSSPVYGYMYLLSPAKGWNKFGSLDITVNTHYYIMNYGYGFTKVDDEKYVAHYDSLPNGELEILLSVEPYPERVNNYKGHFTPAILLPVIAIAFGILLGVAAIVCAIVIPIVFKKKKA